MRGSLAALVWGRFLALLGATGATCAAPVEIDYWQYFFKEARRGDGTR